MTAATPRTTAEGNAAQIAAGESWSTTERTGFLSPLRYDRNDRGREDDRNDGRREAMATAPPNWNASAAPHCRSESPEEPKTPRTQASAATATKILPKVVQLYRVGAGATVLGRTEVYGDCRPPTVVPSPSRNLKPLARNPPPRLPRPARNNTRRVPNDGREQRGADCSRRIVIRLPVTICKFN